MDVNEEGRGLMEVKFGVVFEVVCGKFDGKLFEFLTILYGFFRFLLDSCIFKKFFLRVFWNFLQVTTILILKNFRPNPIN